MLQVRLGRDLEKKLGDLSKWTGRTKEELVCETVQNYLEEVALYYQAVSALKKHEKSEKLASTLEEVRKELGLESDIDEESNKIENHFSMKRKYKKGVKKLWEF